MGNAVNTGDAVNVDDAVNVSEAVLLDVGDAFKLNVGDDVIVDNCDVATVGDGNITLVSTVKLQSV
jgi:predicted amino acid racemase